MKLKTVMFPNHRLTDPKFDDVEHWDEITKSIKKLWAAMRANKRKSFAMAANQAHVKHRLFVMNHDGVSARAFIHPKITVFSADKSDFVEGCLSFAPNIGYKIKRPNTITLSYMNEKGEGKVESFSGFEARVIQHEVDHLEGITMFDRWKEQGKRI